MMHKVGLLIYHQGPFCQDIDEMVLPYNLHDPFLHT